MAQEFLVGSGSGAFSAMTITLYYDYSGVVETRRNLRATREEST